MKSIRFRTIFGGRVLVSLMALSSAALMSCYGFSGGGGFPSDIRTIYIQPFENTTVQFELADQLFRKLQERVPRALGIRPAGETAADSWLRGRITRYEDVAQNYRTDPNRTVEVELHQVQITVTIELVNRRNNTILWESSSLTGRGEYNPQSQNDLQGRDQALNHIVQQLIDGAQSQW
jgi:hypothetical protein